MRATGFVGYGALLAVLAGGCGGDSSNSGDDDAQADAGDAGDPPDAGDTPPPAEPIMTPLSATGSDQFFAAAYATDGKFYATGYSAPGTDATADRSLVLARFNADGTLDDGFGEAGVATVNVAVGGRNQELARTLVVQSTGKIVIGGTVEHDVAAEGLLADDRDVVLVRFTPEGELDPTFSEDGILTLDLNDGVVSGETLAAADNLWSITLAADDKLVLHANQRAVGAARTDTDWALLRLTADGEPDDTFSGDGRFTLDIQQVNGTARAAVVLADGSIVGTGYANTPGLGSVQAVMYKVTPAGELDDAFGTGGIFHEIVLPAVTEVYGAVVIDDKLVTTGYGKAVADAPNDIVSLRVNGDGTLDTTWGEDGAIVIDVNSLNDQARSIAGLPDGRVLMVGTGTPADGASDAMFVVLDQDGAPDTRFGEGGRKLFDLGGPTDHFWGAAISPSGERAVIVGLRGAGAEPTATNNDDAAILLMPME